MRGDEKLALFIQILPRYLVGTWTSTHLVRGDKQQDNYSYSLLRICGIISVQLHAEVMSLIRLLHVII